MKLQNTTADLNNHLFEALERLNDEDIMSDPELARAEIKRAQAIAAVSRSIIDNNTTILQAAKLKLEYGLGKNELPSELLKIEDRESEKI